MARGHGSELNRESDYSKGQDLTKYEEVDGMIRVRKRTKGGAPVGWDPRKELANIPVIDFDFQEVDTGGDNPLVVESVAGVYKPGDPNHPFALEQNKSAKEEPCPPTQTAPTLDPAEADDLLTSISNLSQISQTNSSPSTESSPPSPPKEQTTSEQPKPNQQESQPCSTSRSQTEDLAPILKKLAEKLTSQHNELSSEQRKIADGLKEIVTSVDSLAAALARKEEELGQQHTYRVTMSGSSGSITTAPLDVSVDGEASKVTLVYGAEDACWAPANESYLKLAVIVDGNQDLGEIECHGTGPAVRCTIAGKTYQLVCLSMAP